MEHSYISNGFYSISEFAELSIRNKIRMKDTVDIDALRRAVNIATRRYPYFKVQVHIDNEGTYIVEQNDREIVVVPTSAHNPGLGSEEANGHLVSVDCEDRDIYFNISHVLSGGKGICPWLMTCMYQYIVEKYGITPDAPYIRKPDSPLLDGETLEPTLEMTAGSVEMPLERYKGAKNLIFDYFNGVYNPFVRSHEYFEFEFAQNDIMKYAKGTDNSVCSFFNILMFKTLSKVFPNAGKFVGTSMHNPASELGIPNTYVNVLSNIMLLFTDDMKNWDLERLGTVTRGAMLLQTDPMYSRLRVKRTLEYNAVMESKKTVREKKKYEYDNNPQYCNSEAYASFTVSYAGYADWGEVADYIESYYHIVDGHQLLELSATRDRIFCAYMQVTRTDKFIKAFKQVLDELDIPYTIRGPFKKNLSKHCIGCR